jgi:hypothetical protein
MPEITLGSNQISRKETSSYPKGTMIKVLWDKGKARSVLLKLPRNSERRFAPALAASSTLCWRQERLMDWGIKFRPVKPGSPRLNGKVERSKRSV